MSLTAKKTELKKEIAELEEQYNAADTPQNIKDMLKGPLENARKQLKDVEALIEKETPAAQPVVKKEERQTEQIIKAAKKVVSKVKQAKKEKTGGKKQKKTLQQIIAGNKTLAKLYAGKSARALKADAGRKALKPGTRTSASGKEYREYRADRSDLSGRAPYLAKGGGVKNNVLNVSDLSGPIYRYISSDAELGDGKMQVEKVSEYYYKLTNKEGSAYQFGKGASADWEEEVFYFLDKKYNHLPATGNSLGDDHQFASGGDTSLTKLHSGRYLELATQGNKLHIFLTDEGKEWIEENGPLTEQNFSDLFEDIQGNSEMMYLQNLGDAGLGMTEAPGITDGYFYGEKGELENHADAKLWYYNDYAINDFAEKLSNDGEVDFDEAGSFAKGGSVAREDLTEIKKFTDAFLEKSRFAKQFGKDAIRKEAFSENEIIDYGDWSYGQTYFPIYLATRPEPESYSSLDGKPERINIFLQTEMNKGGVGDGKKPDIARTYSISFEVTGRRKRARGGSVLKKFYGYARSIDEVIEKFNDWYLQGISRGFDAFAAEIKETKYAHGGDIAEIDQDIRIWQAGKTEEYQWWVNNIDGNGSHLQGVATITKQSWNHDVSPSIDIELDFVEKKKGDAELFSSNKELIKRSLIAEIGRRDVYSEGEKFASGGTVDSENLRAGVQEFADELDSLIMDFDTSSNDDDDDDFGGYEEDDNQSVIDYARTELEEILAEKTKSKTGA